MQKILLGVLIAVTIAVVLLLVIRFFFPELVGKFTTLLICLISVVTGGFLRRKK